MLRLNELTEALRARTWSVDCPEMRLRRESTSGPTEFDGPGHLRIERDGTISYKLYPRPTGTFDLWSNSPDRSVAGQIVTAERFYQLEAMDKSGILWRCERTLPNVDRSFVRDRQFTSVTGIAHELVATRSQAQSVSSLTLMFFTTVRVPGNASTEITTVTPDGSTSRQSQLDTAQFNTAFGAFNIYNRPGTLVVEVISQEPFPDHFATRVVETLAFVLAKPLSWAVFNFVENGIETIRLRGDKEAVDAKLQPPVVGGTIDISGGDVWRLFDKYLGMVCARTESGIHPCSKHVFSVLQASAGTIGARALALGVAVEGLAKDLFPEAAALPATLKPLVKQLRHYIRSWPEFKNGATKEALYSRVDAMIGRVLDVSAKSRLYALANERGVFESHIEAWNDLRHASAHGVTPGSDLQQLVDLCDTVTVLMYHLVFRAIGYEGRYRDYSVHGWPKKYYRGRPPTDEEIAIAAYFIWKNGGEQDGHEIEHWFAGKMQLEKGTY